MLRLEVRDLALAVEHEAGTEGCPDLGLHLLCDESLHLLPQTLGLLAQGRTHAVELLDQANLALDHDEAVAQHGDQEGGLLLVQERDFFLLNTASGEKGSDFKSDPAEALKADLMFAHQLDDARV